MRRLGFRVFREYLPGRGELPDVDSGPVILGAGATATGVGLAAALANGDLRTAQDIAGLARVLGCRQRIRTEDGSGFRYLGGRFPIGDAFLAWAYTIPDVSEPSSTAVSPLRLIRDRMPLAVILLLLALMWIGFGMRAFQLGHRKV